MNYGVNHRLGPGENAPHMNLTGPGLPGDSKWATRVSPEFVAQQRVVAEAIRIHEERAEQDPRGLDAHALGAKLDHGKNRLGLLLDFARAIEEVGKVATFGAQKYTDGGWQHVDDGIRRYTDALLRHLMAEGRGEDLDRQMGICHAAAVAWNALARLELMLRERRT